jgi:hypothetical protein
MLNDQSSQNKFQRPIRGLTDIVTKKLGIF